MFMPIIPKKIVEKVLKEKEANISLGGWDLAIGLYRRMARTGGWLLCPLTKGWNIP